MGNWFSDRNDNTTVSNYTTEWNRLNRQARIAEDARQRRLRPWSEALDSLEWQRQREEAKRRRREQEKVLRLLQALSISDADSRYASKSKPKSICINPTVVKDCLQNVVEYNSFTYNVIGDNSVYKLFSLEVDSPEYMRMKTIFTKSNKHFFKVTEIQKIINPYLLAQFSLMKLRYGEMYGFVEVKMLFHGTKLANVDNICKYNFDWRLNEKHKFGQGVSFTPISYYATHYSDKTYNKVMLVANVLVSKRYIGNKDTIMPMHGYDTTTNKTEQVFVKYEDSTFYPAYVIHYQGIRKSGNRFTLE